jgi:hypothetical protein
MRLTDLEPEWIYDYNPTTHGMRRADDSHTPSLHSTRGNPDWPPSPRIDIANVQGIMFLCPTCFKKNGGPVGTESVLCYFRDRGVANDAKPGPGRWLASGIGFEDLTLSPSVNVADGHWHGYVSNGEVT